MYRGHGEPDPDRLEELANFVGRMGYKINYTGTPAQIAESLNQLLDKVQGKGEENLVETLVIRTMQKAIYQTDNIGTTAVFSTTHTLPAPLGATLIMVHRLLTHYLAGGKVASKTNWKTYASTTPIWNA